MTTQPPVVRGRFKVRPGSTDEEDRDERGEDHRDHDHDAEASDVGNQQASFPLDRRYQSPKRA
jgi:hypothetical protein